ncbi:hypothetical protein LBMAG56_51470 [Verrucomicrobiota bacterium]|nr:hypothetical protein LBMAG56_51470 [Verrucomicrobiota bacterium]
MGDGETFCLHSLASIPLPKIPLPHSRAAIGAALRSERVATAQRRTFAGADLPGTKVVLSRS